jgi:hypothetical protein
MPMPNMGAAKKVVLTIAFKPARQFFFSYRSSSQVEKRACRVNLRRFQIFPINTKKTH